MANRVQLTITIAMLEAGERAMALCRETGGHTPRTACHAIFQAMLAVSNWSPAIRVRPGDRRTPSRAAAHPLAWYQGKSLGAYAWCGFHARDGLHYLRRTDPFEKWIRVTDEQWHSGNPQWETAYNVPIRTARACMGIKHPAAKHSHHERQRRGQFDITKP